MTNTNTTSSHSQLIAASNLEKSLLNARRTVVSMGMDELKASLLAHGLMQNLVVTNEGHGRYRVIAGGRRLAAIHALQSEGKLPEDFAVPCQIVTEQHALEMSLAENTVRLAMHPADQFEAFAALIEQGESASDVAARFGVDESLVLKRMKLARVAPELLAEYRKEEMTLECLMAYTVTDDHRRQLEVFNSLADWQREHPFHVRAALTEKMVKADDKLAKFVTIDAYRTAGGTIRADLFGDAVYLESPALLNRLAQEKLDGIRRELEADGWGWVEINPQLDYDTLHRCGRIQPRPEAVPPELLEQKASLERDLDEVERALDDTESDALLEKQDGLCEQLAELEEKLAGFEGYEAREKALAGCFVSLATDGTPAVDKGLIRPEHKELLEKLLSPGGADAPATTKPKDAMPESLRRDLAAQRLAIAQVEIASHPAIALDLLAFHAAVSLIGKREVTDGPAVKFLPPKPGMEQKPSTATARLSSIGKKLPIGWLKPKSDAERFEAFRRLPQQSRLDLLAYAVTLTLQPKLGGTDAASGTAYDAALALTGASVAEYWRPTADNFLNRRRRDDLLAIGREVLGEQWAKSSTDKKKSVLVTQLDRAFSNPDKAGTDREHVAKLKAWLPAGMGFGTATPPKTAKPAKVKRAA
jgi:ParB family chromosome partitioning protein